MEQKRLAIIPARGGSKRIPRKNIKAFLGKPILAYSIEAALESELFDTVMVSTDDPEIAEVGKKYGASVPFLRSAENANDTAGTAEALLEVIERYAEQGETFVEGCCLYATAPFITPEKLRFAYQKMQEDSFDSVFTATRFPSPIQRALRQTDAGKIEMIWPENRPKRSQDLEPTYHDAGQFYWFKSEALQREKRLFMSNSGMLEVPTTEVQDIDEPEDWTLAELKYQFWQQKKS
ncbi:MAG: pseudaminic acid cytidylyltransferase [Bacteroidota bacterium]